MPRWKKKKKSKEEEKKEDTGRKNKKKKKCGLEVKDGKNRGMYMSKGNKREWLSDRPRGSRGCVVSFTSVTPSG